MACISVLYPIVEVRCRYGGGRISFGGVSYEMRGGGVAYERRYLEG